MSWARAAGCTREARSCPRTNGRRDRAAHYNDGATIAGRISVTIDDYLPTPDASEGSGESADEFRRLHRELAAEVWPHYLTYRRGLRAWPLVDRRSREVRKLFKREVEWYDEVIAEAAVPIGGNTSYTPRSDPADAEPDRGAGVYLDVPEDRFIYSGTGFVGLYIRGRVEQLRVDRWGPHGAPPGTRYRRNKPATSEVSEAVAFEVWRHRDRYTYPQFTDPIRDALLRIAQGPAAGGVGSGTPNGTVPVRHPYTGGGDPAPQWVQLEPLLHGSGDFDDVDVGPRYLPDWSDRHVQRRLGRVTNVGAEQAFTLLESVFKLDPFRWERWCWTKPDTGRFELRAIGAGGSNDVGGRSRPHLVWDSVAQVVTFEVPVG